VKEKDHRVLDIETELPRSLLYADDFYLRRIVEKVVEPVA
jgi:hypothetical protein